MAIVNEAFARRFYPNQNVIGKTIRMLPPPELIPPQPANQPPEPLAPYRTVVGMVADLKNSDANQPADPEVFAPFTQFEGEGWSNGPMFAVRTDQDPATLASGIRNVVAEMDPQQPVAEISPMTQLLERSVAQSRFNAIVAGNLRGHGAVAGSHRNLRRDLLRRLDPHSGDWRAHGIWEPIAGRSCPWS